MLLNPRAAHVGEALKGFLSPLPPAPPGIPLPSYAWRPLTELSFALNRALTGDSVTGLRLGNLLILALASLAAFWALRGIAPAQAPWAALAFAAHPLVVHAATYVYQRSVLLEALLLFLTLGLCLRERRWTALGAGLLAMGAKEPAVTLPLVLLAAAWILREPGRPFLRRWLPFALLPVVVLVQVWRGMPPGQEGFRESGYYHPEAGFTPVQYLLLQIPILVRYLSLAFLPFPLCVNRDQVLPLPGAGPGIPWGETALSAGVLAGLAAWILIGPERHRLARLGLALFLAPLALESSVFPIKDLFFHHRAVPGLLGAGLLIGLAAARRPAWGAATLLLLALGARAESRTWTDTDALTRRDVRHAFHVATAWTHHASGMKDPAAAERILRLPLRLPWLDSRALAAHAQALMDCGRGRDARPEIAKGLARAPRSTDLLGSAVRLSILEGDEAALDRLADRLAKLPALPPPLAAWLVGRRRGQGRSGEAEGVLRRSRAMFPEDPLLGAMSRSGPRSGSPASR